MNIEYNIFILILMISARIIPIISLWPGSEYIFVRYKVLLGVFIGINILNIVDKEQYLFAIKNNFFYFLGTEIFIGLFLGLLIKIIKSTVAIFASLVTSQTSLANASIFDPESNASNPLLSRFLSLISLTIFMQMDGIYILIKVILNSFAIKNISFENMEFLKYSYIIINDIFLMGIKLAFPAMIVGLAIQISTAFMLKLAPNLPIYFNMMPLQIIIIFILLLMSLGSIMFFLQEYYTSMLLGLSLT
ncbi:MAG: flagellar biosynthetic protein FliR [Anaplasmataceae bacterium]|nr:flagellar biosynthetic protein FliR [Anaplasmataceae bacterium]